MGAQAGIYLAIGIMMVSVGSMFVFLVGQALRVERDQMEAVALQRDEIAHQIERDLGVQIQEGHWPFGSEIAAASKTGRVAGIGSSVESGAIVVNIEDFLRQEMNLTHRLLKNQGTMRGAGSGRAALAN